MFPAYSRNMERIIERGRIFILSSCSISIVADCDVCILKENSERKKGGIDICYMCRKINDGV